MFNTVQWDADLKSMKEQVETDPDKSWINTVNLRYGFFMLEQARRQIRVIQRGDQATQFEEMEPARARQRRDHYADETLQVCSLLHAAAALIRGAVISPDPLNCEAVMRLSKLVNPKSDVEEA